jgi:uncharacterized membrane protein
MANSSDQLPKPPLPKSGFWTRIRNYFFTGMIITAPIVITVYLAWILIDFIDRKVTQIIPKKFQLSEIIGFDIPGAGIIIGLLILIIIGFITANYFGRTLIKTGEKILDKMPFIRSVYGASKQIFETLFAQQSSSFRQVVLVEFPRKGVRELAFITGQTEGEIQNMTEDVVYNVFVPATPNPTTGFLLFVPKQDLIFLSMSVDEGLKMIISGGMVTPKDLRPDEQKNKPIISKSNEKFNEEKS